MGLSMKHMSLIVGTFGSLSFILGVVAENKKPASGTAIPGKVSTICMYPSDPTVFLGYLSTGFLVASSIAGICSLFYPYKGKSVPQSAFFKSTTFSIFFSIAVFTSGLAMSLLLWPTTAEQSYRSHKVPVGGDCPTAKTGLLGGGAFVSLDSTLFWLVALMLADNVREDHFEDLDKSRSVNETATVV